ncbi:protein of unknown function [Xenorhabdus bovienii]|uniref:Uncharacterized protein n=1 Tax=Xenorhabdus bovienii TaxID=40576 RepID=A0A0B6XGE1_XENBV|nr:protein of unknown function [Xenorhabdus bovienii]
MSACVAVMVIGVAIPTVGFTTAPLQYPFRMGIVNTLLIPY